jgi:pimeloyl-ACP methyl ester carboxylesterase
MFRSPDVLCLNVSPALQVFDHPLLKTLANHLTIAQWEYCQTPDEPSSFEVALVLLHDYLKHHSHPIHLIGHGRSGLLALLYAQRHPERVRSLSLLSVGVNAAMDWQSYYYAQRQSLPCSRQVLLTQIVDALFGDSSGAITKAAVKLLAQDLDCALSPHSLFKQISLPPIEVSVPLLVCGSVDDVVVTPHQLRSWQRYFHEENSRLWVCPGGRYFFHYFYPQQVAEQMLHFWHSFSKGQSIIPSEELLIESMATLQVSPVAVQGSEL